CVPDPRRDEAEPRYACAARTERALRRAPLPPEPACRCRGRRRVPGARLGRQALARRCDRARRGDGMPALRDDDAAVRGSAGRYVDHAHARARSARHARGLRDRHPARRGAYRRRGGARLSAPFTSTFERSREVERIAVAYTVRRYSGPGNPIGVEFLRIGDLLATKVTRMPGTSLMNAVHGLENPADLPA